MIDAATPRDCLRQLALLARPEDRILSIGRPPEHVPFAARAVHCPLGMPPLAARRLRAETEGCRVLHAWSRFAAEAATPVAARRRQRLLLTVPFAASAATARDLAAAAHRENWLLAVPTRTLRTHLISLRVGAADVRVVPPAAEPVDRAARRAAARRALGLAEDDFLFVAPQEMTRHAGHKHVAWAHAIVREIGCRAKVLLVGDGPARPFVENFADSTGFGHEVLRVGYRLPPAECLAAADAAAFLAKRDRGVGGLAAAMAAGLPALCTRLAGQMETCPEGEASVGCEPGVPRTAAAGMLKLIEQDGLAERLGGNAKARAEAFRPAAIRAALDEIYAELAG